MTEIELVLLPFVSAFAGGYIGAMLARAPVGKPRQFNTGYAVAPEKRVLVKTVAHVVADTMPQSAAAHDAVEFRLTGGSVKVTKRDVRRFVEMPAPTRAQWTGSRAVYGQLKQVGIAGRWLILENNRGDARWAHEWRTLGKRVGQLQERYRLEL
jgi:hypothetical protein